MPGDGTNITIEGFVVDQAFVDQSKAINSILVNDGGVVGSLTPAVLSYFNTPSVFKDTRLPANRSINWVAETAPSLIIDKDIFGAFLNTINNLPGSFTPVFFKLIDKLFFNHDPAVTTATIEASLLADPDINKIYVPKSFRKSSVIVRDKVYLTNKVSNVDVPSYIDFSLALPTGSTITTYILRLYTSASAWLEGYNVSTIVEIIPPLPYEKLYEDGLVTSVDNIFTTATTTTVLSYVNTKMVLGTVTISGITEYKAILTDGVNTNSVPFNILYKGRPPTLFEIRNAMKTELLGSGVGNERGWRDRIPGVFVEGRFYVIPFWDQKFIKPDQEVYPNIAKYTDYQTLTQKLIGSLGYGNVSSYMDILSIYYNHMTACAIPDMSGTISISHLIDLIPDYQDYSPDHEQFAYMQKNTQSFVRQLNTVLTVDSGAITSTVYTPSKEGLLTFYSFTVGSYEICVISRLCYESIMGSTQ